MEEASEGAVHDVAECAVVGRGVPEPHEACAERAAHAAGKAHSGYEDRVARRCLRGGYPAVWAAQRDSCRVGLG